MCLVQVAGTGISHVLVARHNFYACFCLAICSIILTAE